MGKVLWSIDTLISNSHGKIVWPQSVALSYDWVHNQSCCQLAHATIWSFCCYRHNYKLYFNAAKSGWSQFLLKLPFQNSQCKSVLSAWPRLNPTLLLRRLSGAITYMLIPPHLVQGSVSVNKKALREPRKISKNVCYQVVVRFKRNSCRHCAKQTIS